ncbi:MAG: hypothetical protein V9E94_20205 [Microthrixaceae bacterium]
MGAHQIDDRRRLGQMAAAGTVALLVLLGGAACSDDDGDSASEDNTETTVGTDSDDSMPDGESVTVTAEDYKFVGLPETVKVGTRLTLENSSQTELHELVAMRIPDSETRSVEEITQLPEAEADAIFGDAMPAMVLVRAPGDAEMIPAVGDGTFSEPGRYGVFCAIPVGADPAAMMAAMQEQSDAPPTTGAGDGPPHFTQGMYAEVIVEE